MSQSVKQYLNTFCKDLNSTDKKSSGMSSCFRAKKGQNGQNVQSGQITGLHHINSFITFAIAPNHGPVAPSTYVVGNGAGAEKHAEEVMDLLAF